MQDFDLKKIEQGVKLILEGLGESTNDACFQQTPARVAQTFCEILANNKKQPYEFLKTLTEEYHEEMVIIKDIPFYSMCLHHLLPFFGTASICYIPKKGKIMGLNTLAYLVDFLSKRLQLQERLTKQIADYLEETLQPLGVMVVIEAEHLCMTMRGAKKPGSKIITSGLRGVFLDSIASRQEALNLLSANRK